MADGAGRQRVEGPITGGVHGWPFGRSLFDLADHGQVEKEFFLNGDELCRIAMRRSSRPSDAKPSRNVCQPHASDVSQRPARSASCTARSPFFTCSQHAQTKIAPISGCGSNAVRFDANQR